MKRRTFIQSCAAGAVAIIADRPLSAQGSVEGTLEGAFLQPPVADGPYTWYHWMNGNITADGITRDMEAMKRVGVAGFQVFQVSDGIVPGPVRYGSPEHLDILLHSIREADRLDLAYEMHSCPGWSSTGGPWITPELSMQQLVWTEAYVTGGKQVRMTLPTPYTKKDYYQDAYVLAFPSLPGEHQSTQAMLIRASTNNSSSVDVQLVTDVNLSQGVEVEPGGGQGGFLLLELAEPTEIQSIAVTTSIIVPPGVRNRSTGTVALEASDDGTRFRKVADLDVLAARENSIEAPSTATFSPVRAKYFRLVSPEHRRYAAVGLFAAPLLPEWPMKAGMGSRNGPGGSALAGPPPQEATSGPAIDPDSVIDITGYLDAEGLLDWQAPEGNWTILRLGHTSVGIENHPAPAGGEGLECDKYSREAMDFHFNHFFSELLPTMAPLLDRHKVGSLIDSYEVGMQTWTPAFPQEFLKRRGYSPLSYLPALTGRIVGSADSSGRFLWDVRRTNADMMADNYYGRFAELCQQHGIISYTEPYDGGPFEQMQAGSRVDIPMGEFWVRRPDESATRRIKLASSIAHVNGKAVVGAESFTGGGALARWLSFPYAMKAQGDWMWTEGLNRYIFHRYAQQPHPTAVPGMTMGPHGWHFDRTNTWFDQGAAWLQYVTRSQHMLQQGLYVADLAYFTGEDAPMSTTPEPDLDPALPDGYEFDHINAEVILNRASARDGRLTLPDGMSYQVLVIPDDISEVTVEVMRKIRDLVNGGVCVYGPKPQHSPTMTGYPNDDTEVRRIADELWGELDGTTLTERGFGQGRVFWGQPLNEVLESLGVPPDFEYTARSTDPAINYIHKTIGDAEVYFVANRQRRSEDLVCTFRVDGKQPEFWDAVTGEVKPVGVFQMTGGRVRVPLRLDPAGSMFVVFRNSAPARPMVEVSRDGSTVVSTIDFPKAIAGLHRDVTDNFTVSVWVKPEVDVLPATSFVFYAPEGDTVYGAGHASVALSVGRNGVSAYERVRGDIQSVVEAEMPLSGWTHVALVYRQGVPSLYVDGRLATQGRKSSYTVHPGLGEPAGPDIMYFEGEQDQPELIPEALSDTRIQQLAAGRPLPEEPPALEIAADNEPALLFWQNGDYSLRSSAGNSSSMQISGLSDPMDLTGSWNVSFPPHLGAPARITLPELISLHRHDQDGVKYFSGTATYSKQFNLPSAAKADGKRVFLDLGRVEVIAEVRVNGRELGNLWKPPYRVDITDVAVAGNNDLEVRVTNLWPNRLIGDEQLPPENEYGPSGGILKIPDWYTNCEPKPPGGRITFTTWHHFDKDSPLVESGLVGPVRLRIATQRTLDV